jgi:acetyl-CoA carboxylase biotin carboxyl carrier protein
MNLTNEDVEEIVKLLDSSFYDELRLTTAKFELHLRRSAEGWTQETRTLAAATINQPAPAADAPGARASNDEVAGLISVRAPMVGTFYRAPKPGAPPFVEVGSEVHEHTVVGIIETMKLMNSVGAGASGEVVEILAANGEVVEAGQALMRLKSAGA